MTTSLGLYVEVELLRPGSDRYKARLIGVRATRDAELIPTCSVVLALLADSQQDHPQQLASLASALQAHLGAHHYDRILLRTADHGPSRPRDNLVFARLSAEGVALAVSRTHVSQIERLRGREIAGQFGGVKETVDAAAGQLCSQCPPAASAAILALLL